MHANQMKASQGPLFKTMDFYRHSAFRKSVASLSALLLIAAQDTSIAQQLATWSGEGSDTKWSNLDNWTGGPPAGKGVVFGNAGIQNPGIIGSTIDFLSAVPDGIVTIERLSFQNFDKGAGIPAQWHTLEIEEGVTLKIQGGTGNVVDVGSEERASTFAAIQGSGTLSIDQSNANINISGRLAGASLDLHRLHSFEANVANIIIGSSRLTGAIDYVGSLTLANHSVLKAAGLYVGQQTNTGKSTGQVLLGTTTSLLIDEIQIGATTGATGSLKFASEIENGFVRIEGRNSTPEARVRTNLTVGLATGTRTTATSGTADFTGGQVDAYLQNLVIAKKQTSTGLSSGVVRMDQGVMDVVHTTIGDRATGNVEGELSVEGGDFTTRTLVIAKGAATTKGVLNITGSANVTVLHDEAIAESGGISMGTGGSDEDSSATINLTGGSLTVNGDIRKGVASTTATALVLQGGALDMKGHSITVDSLALHSGTLKSLGQFNEGATLKKTSGGLGSTSLQVEGVNSYTGDTKIEQGEMILVDGASLDQTSAVSIQSGASFGGSGSVNTAAAVTLEEGASLAFTLASTLDYDHLSLGNLVLEEGANLTLMLTFSIETSASFSILSATNDDWRFSTLNGLAIEADDSFFLSYDGTTYQGHLVYGGPDLIVNLQAIPEPKTSLSILAGGALFLGAYRLRLRA